VGRIEQPIYGQEKHTSDADIKEKVDSRYCLHCGRVGELGCSTPLLLREFYLIKVPVGKDGLEVRITTVSIVARTLFEYVPALEVDGRCKIVGVNKDHTYLVQYLENPSVEDGTVIDIENTLEECFGSKPKYHKFACPNLVSLLLPLAL